MANSSRSLKRDKQKLQPISIDELADDSTMRGFSDIFNIPTAPLTQSLTTTLIETPPVETGPFETVPPDTPPLVPNLLPRVRQIREAKSVQEGHTYGEQAVYEALWQKGTRLNENIRLITVGFLKMASIAGLAESNCKAAVAGLIEKLAIEPLSATNISQGRTYRIYNWTAVLVRRRAAGLTHVIKSRGVVFVDPSSGRQLTTPKTAPRHRAKADGPDTPGTGTDGPVSG